MKKAAAIILFLTALAIPALAQSVVHYVTRQAILSPGCLAHIEGVRLTSEPEYAISPKDSMSGVEVTFNGTVAPILAVDFDRALIVVPRLKVRGGEVASISITTTFTTYHAFARVVPSAPAFYMQSIDPPIPVGLYQVSAGAAPIWIDGKEIPKGSGTNATRIMLIGTGWRNGKELMVDINGVQITPLHFGPYANFIGHDCIVFELPGNVEGAVTVRLVSGDFTSAPVVINISVDNSIAT